jgi:UDP-N-acetylglucosamine acyltransferase
VNASIHPTAIIHPSARIHESVQVGAYCTIGEHVEIGEGTKLISHVVIDGRTKIGTNNTIYPFVSLGLPPQDLKFKGEPSELIIGDNNTIREYTTMNTGTEGGGMVTRIGDNCLFMVSTHVAHDCQVGNHVILANNATLAGHVVVGDYVVIGGLAAVHQFVRIGSYAMIGGLSGVEHDVIPYGSVMGERAGLAGLNLVGLKRRGVEREQIHALRNAYKDLFEEDAGTLAERGEAVAKQYGAVDAVREVLDFMKAKSHRQLCMPSKNAQVA